MWEVVVKVLIVALRIAIVMVVVNVVVVVVVQKLCTPRAYDGEMEKGTCL